jgi:hypothetical protein
MFSISMFSISMLSKCIACGEKDIDVSCYWEAVLESGGQDDNIFFKNMCMTSISLFQSLCNLLYPIPLEARGLSSVGDNLGTEYTDHQPLH